MTSVSPLSTSSATDTQTSDEQNNSKVNNKVMPTNMNSSEMDDVRAKSKHSGKDDYSNTKTPSLSWYQRQDVWLWVSGMVFILVLLGLIAAIGNARGWDADTSLQHNETESSQDRFLDEPYVEEPGVRGRYGKDAVARWYYWKLKPELTSFWTHFFPWLCYTLHLVFIWCTIYYAQIKKAQEPLGPGRYSSDLKAYNYVAFGLNTLFHLLHLLCTHVTYDGLAQDTSISTSQSSVVMALCLIILLEYKERGIFFGWPTVEHKGKISRKMRWDYGPINIIRRYHGYAIGWAAIYTCWYHPMENTVGHLLGFFYTWIIMLQGSLMYTDLHLNHYWRLTQEAWVIVHSGVIAAQTGGDDMKGTRLWPRFVFGFTLALVITQLFGLPFWRRIPTWCRFIPLLLYAAVTLWAYSWIPDEDGNTWVRLPEVFTTPSAYYIFFVYGWLLLYLWLKVEKKVYGHSIGISPKPLSAGKQALYLGAALFTYAIHTALAITCEYTDWIAGLVVLMMLFTAIFLTGTTIAFMFLRRAIPLRMLQEQTSQSESTKQQPRADDCHDDEKHNDVDIRESKCSLQDDDVNSNGQAYKNGGFLQNDVNTKF